MTKALRVLRKIKELGSFPHWKE